MFDSPDAIDQPPWEEELTQLGGHSVSHEPMAGGEPHIGSSNARPQHWATCSQHLSKLVKDAQVWTQNGHNPPNIGPQVAKVGQRWPKICSLGQIVATFEQHANACHVSAQRCGEAERKLVKRNHRAGWVGRQKTTPPATTRRSDRQKLCMIRGYILWISAEQRLLQGVVKREEAFNAPTDYPLALLSPVHRYDILGILGALVFVLLAARPLAAAEELARGAVMAGVVLHVVSVGFLRWCSDRAPGIRVLFCIRSCAPRAIDAAVAKVGPHGSRSAAGGILLAPFAPPA